MLRDLTPRCYGWVPQEVVSLGDPCVKWFSEVSSQKRPQPGVGGRVAGVSRDKVRCDAFAVETSGGSRDVLKKQCPSGTSQLRLWVTDPSTAFVGTGCSWGGGPPLTMQLLAVREVSGENPSLSPKNEGGL